MRWPFRWELYTIVTKGRWLTCRRLLVAPFASVIVIQAFGILHLLPAVREALKNIAKDPMARIAERVPGFGGAFRHSSPNIVYIYLQDASMQEEAEHALTEDFGPDFLEGREVRVLEGEYSMDHLAAWYESLKDVAWQVPGISWSDLDEGKNRIEISMYPRRGAREEMEAALARVDVPRGAIVIEI